MSDRRIDAFFYGLFMDVDILKQNGVEPASANATLAKVGTRVRARIINDLTNLWSTGRMLLL